MTLNPYTEIYFPCPKLSQKEQDTLEPTYMQVDETNEMISSIHFD